MRADEHTRRPPQRVLAGQRLGVGDVERRGDAAGLRLGEQGLGVDDRAAGDVDQQRAVLHAGQEVRAGQAPRLLREGRGQHHHVGLGQQLRQGGERVHGTALRLAGGACDASDPRDLEGREPVLDGAADGPVTDDQDGPVGERRTESGPPLAAVLASDEVRYPAQRGEDQRQREFGGARLVHTARVAQPHARGQVPQTGLHVVDARGQRLHHPHGRHRGQRTQHRLPRPHVRHHVEDAVGGVGGEVRTAVPEAVAEAFGEAGEGVGVLRVEREPHVGSHGQEARSGAPRRRG